MAKSTKFIFGRPVTKLEYFYDREELLKGMVDFIIKGQSYALIGFRRMGKTSLFYALSELLRQRNFITTLIDLELPREKGHLDPVSFLRTYHFSILEDYFSQIGLFIKLKHLTREASSKIVMALSKVLGRIESTKFKIESPIGSLDLQVEFEEAVYERRRRTEIEERLLEAVLTLPEALSKESGRKVGVFIDEFQFIKDLKIWRKGIFHTMRSLYQHQKNTVYAISGSSVGLITDILDSKDNPFYMAFMPIEVKPFSLDTARNYLIEGFHGEKLSIDNKALSVLVQSVDGVPAWLSYIGQKCVFKAREQHTKSINEKIASDVVERMFDDPLLRSEIQKDLLKLKTAVKSRRILDVLEVMAKHEISSPSEITRLLSEQEGNPIPESKVLQLYLKRLMEYGYIQKMGRGEYAIVDPILEQYLKRKGK